MLYKDESESDVDFSARITANPDAVVLECI
jgi:hypothetical protein